MNGLVVYSVLLNYIKLRIIKRYLIVKEHTFMIILDIPPGKIAKHPYTKTSDSKILRLTIQNQVFQRFM